MGGERHAVPDRCEKGTFGVVSVPSLAAAKHHAVRRVERPVAIRPGKDVSDTPPQFLHAGPNDDGSMVEGGTTHVGRPSDVLTFVGGAAEVPLESF